MRDDGPSECLTCNHLWRKLDACEKELGEARKYRYTHQEVAAWLDCYEGRYRELTLTEWVAKRRQEAGEVKEP